MAGVRKTVKNNLTILRHLSGGVGKQQRKRVSQVERPSITIAVVSPRFVRNKYVSEQVDVYKIPDSYGTFWEVGLATLKDSYMSCAAKAFIDEYTRYLGV